MGRKLALGILTGILALNVFQWIRNTTQLPAQAQPILRSSSNIHDVALENRGFQISFGCYHLLAERIAGASLVLPPAFHGHDWYFRRIAQLEIETTEDLLALDVEDSIAALNTGLPSETTSCDGKEALVLTEPGQDRYVIATAATEELIILSEAKYESIIAAPETVAGCDLLAPANWLPKTLEQAELSWGEDLSIQVDNRVKKFYLSTGENSGFQATPKTLPCPVEGGETIVISSDIELSGSLGVSFWVIQYGAMGRLTHSSFHPDKTPELFIKLEPETTSVRYAIRVTGEGEATIGEFDVVTAIDLEGPASRH